MASSVVLLDLTLSDPEGQTQGHTTVNVGLTVNPVFEAAPVLEAALWVQANCLTLLQLSLKTN